MTEPPLSVFIAPFFFAFEIAQLVAAEKLLGLRQIEAGVDPRSTGPGELTAALWTGAMLAEGAWLLWLLAGEGTRVYALCLLLVTLLGFTLRSNCTLRWVLVILTIEGALRMGLMVSMLGSAWRAL
jgi:hypothetical protein